MVGVVPVRTGSANPPGYASADTSTEEPGQRELGLGQPGRSRPVGRAEVCDRAARQVVIDDGRAHVRLPRDHRGVSEVVYELTHYPAEDALCMPVRTRRAKPLELGGRQQRAAPGPEVLRGEAVAEVLADVLVEGRRGEVVQLAIALEAEEP